MNDRNFAQSPLRSQSQHETNIVRSSWDRCATEYGLRKNFTRPILLVPPESVEQALAPMEEIIAETAPIVHKVRDTARNANYCVLLCDSSGTVVKGYADSSASRELAEIGLRQGAHWSEDVVGTNGIGTSIVARHAISICGRHHYNQTLHGYNCCAAPFFAPDGTVLGVLDVSGRAELASSEHVFAEHFVRGAAADISCLLFRKWHSNDRIVALSNDPLGLEFAPRAMIAANDQGQIIGATRDALALLGVAELVDLEHKTVDELWDVSIDDLRPMATNHVRLTTAKTGIDAYALTFLPPTPKRLSTRPKVYASAPSKAPTAKTLHVAKSKTAPASISLDAIAGSDARMKWCIDLSRKLNNSDIPILLLGETGVGKDSFARAFHEESMRHDKPYTAVNCAAIPETLLASELFGYAPGTFTGGLKSGRVGKIAASNGGTLFLDEIGDMPVDLQAHLLRVLEEREVTPLGAKEPVSVDVRIICATHQRLPEQIANGLFRKDLYYRIKGAQLTLSPLRERTDIDNIIETIVADERGDGAEVTISDEVMEIFRSYAWPGNIRELKSVLRLILSVNDDDVITRHMLPEELMEDAFGISAQTTASQPVGALSTITKKSASATLGDAQGDAEKARILQALDVNKWCVTRAAKELAISRATLHRKIRKYEIISPNERES